MSSSTLTTNKNLLQQNQFKLTIDHTKYGNIEFFTSAASLPSVTNGEIPTNYRNKPGFLPGERVDYEPLNIRLRVDEDMKNYLEVLNWMITNGTTTGVTVADITLSILSSHNNVNKEFQFIDAFPTSLGSLEFTTDSTEVEYFTIDATFRYDYFKAI